MLSYPVLGFAGEEQRSEHGKCGADNHLHQKNQQANRQEGMALLVIYK